MSESYIQNCLITISASVTDEASKISSLNFLVFASYEAVSIKSKLISYSLPECVFLRIVFFWHGLSTSTFLNGSLPETVKRNTGMSKQLPR